MSHLVKALENVWQELGLGRKQAAE
jgi:hypothetical protein